MNQDQDLQDRAASWIEDDPDPATRAALTSLLEQAASGDGTAQAELADAFTGTLQFGTAGLRGRMGPGPNRMNLAVVSRAARGLADHLTGDLALDQPQVIIGYDARYNSRAFAERSAAIMTAAGCRVQLFDTYQPTPLAAFAVRHLEADAAVVVTASHNPPADNGYKVYLGGRAAAPEGRGVQIVPPSDAQIAARIAAVGPVLGIEVAESGWEILGESGSDAITVAALCERVGVTKGSFHHHFGTMPGFVEALAQHWESAFVGIIVARELVALPALVEADTDTLVAAYGPTIQRYLTEPF